MSEKLRESLSAAIDDEADEFELRRVLDEMHKDPELRHLWERYHTVGRLIRGEAVEHRLQLRDRVWAALDETDVADEPDLVAGVAGSGRSRSGPASWTGRVTGMVVAATVAIAVFFGVDLGDEAQPQVADSAVGAAAISATIPLTIEGPVRRAPSIGAEISPSDLARANAYMMHHVQQKALNQPGVTSFVKLVTFEER